MTAGQGHTKWMRLGLLLLGAGTLLAYGLYGRAPGMKMSKHKAPAGVAALEAALEAGTGDLLVDLKDDADPQAIAKLERELGAKLEDNSRYSRPAKLMRIKGKGKSRRALVRLLERLRKHPLVEVAEPDMLYSAI